MRSKSTVCLFGALALMMIAFKTTGADSSTLSADALGRVRGHGAGFAKTNPVNCAQNNVGPLQKTNCAGLMAGVECIACVNNPAQKGDKGTGMQVTPGYINSDPNPRVCGRKQVGQCDGRGGCVENVPNNITQCDDLFTMVLQEVVPPGRPTAR